MVVGKSDTELQHPATICGELWPMSVTLRNRVDMLSCDRVLNYFFQ